MRQRADVVVVGGGIAGLAAAHRLGADRDVLLLEATGRVGGKLRTEPVAGVPVDVGAEAMLARRPEGVDLARELGLEVVHPALTASRVWVHGGLRPLPRSLMGVPLDPEDLASSGVLSGPGLARATDEPALPPLPPGEDVSVGDLVAARLGPEVVDRLVEPLLGGVYAGHARLLSARAAVPQLVALAERGRLTDGAAGLTASYAGGAAGPVFAAVADGMGRLPEALAGYGRFETRTEVVVRELHRTRTGFRLVTGPAPYPVEIDARAVVLATPAAPTARLLAGLVPEAAAELAAVESASVAVVTLAYRAGDVPEALGRSSGFLVPPTEGRRIKASTFSFAKWAQVREAGRGAGPGGEDLLLLRTSLGRHGEERSVQAFDRELVEVSRAELAEATGLDAEPVSSHVQRWGGGLPQYAVGHLDRVRRVRDAVAGVPGLAVCGAAYDGVGIPAVIASAHRAAADLPPAQ